MGPIAKSAFEVYQQQSKKLLKKKAKRLKRQGLQQQLSVSGLNVSPGGSSSLSRAVAKVESGPEGSNPQGIVKTKAKALKRLGVGPSNQREAKKLQKERTEGSSQTDFSSTNSLQSDMSLDSPEKKAKDISSKKAQIDSGKKAQIDSGKKAQIDSGKKAKIDSGKKAKIDSGKKVKIDSGKKVKIDSGKKAKIDSGKKAKIDSGKKAMDDLGEEATNDVGKARDDSGKKAKVAKKAMGELTKPPGSRKRIVNQSESLNVWEGKETLPKHTEKKKRIKGGGEIPASEGSQETRAKHTQQEEGESSESEVGKIPKFLVDKDVPIDDSQQSGREVLQWILTPILIPTFQEKYWERRPLYISRSFHRDFFDGILSSEDIDKVLREQTLQFTRNVDVTSYVGGVRETHNPIGRAHAFTVWDYYRNGCSVRLLNPQTYFERLRKICTFLQEFFTSFVGANVYLTPPNSQGFAPHYDDIEAFVLQLEGKKKWKVYAPWPHQKLPRAPSINFLDEELPGEPLLEIELQPGDLLYMPRGFIHQACTSDSHSLHVTISTYQNSSWADVMEKVTLVGLATAIDDDPEFREGVPWDFFQNTGIVFSTDITPRRSELLKKMRYLLKKVLDFLPLDAAADQMAKDFLHESLPPMLQSGELSRSIHGDGTRMRNGDVGRAKQLTMDHSVKLVRRNVLRIVSETVEGVVRCEHDEFDDTLTIYHSAENPLTYKGDDLKCCKIHVELAVTVEALIRNYPNYMRIADLPAKDKHQKLQMIMSLWERGVLISKEPAADVSDSDD